MKRKSHNLGLLAILFIILPVLVNAQVIPGRILERAKRQTERKVEQRVNQHVDKVIDNAIDDVEDAIDGKEKPVEKTTKKTETTPPAPQQQKQPTLPAQEVTQPAQVPVNQQPELSWDQFDFVPGDIIIFEDNLEGERNGEFPSKWDLVNGTIENAFFDGGNVILFSNNNINSIGGIVPMMANSSEDYLPDEFTIEFDAFFDSPQRVYRILFYDGKNQSRLNRSANPGAGSATGRVRVSQNSAVFGSTYGYYPGFNSSTSNNAAMSQPGWRRISISFNKRALKVYIDDARVLNIPNMNYNPLGITMAYHTPSGAHQGYIKNIRIAQGAVPLYDKFLTDGKIITNGIRFDVNKSTIRPESMGVINEIVQLMKQHAELNFSVEGHTDSDGSAELNQSLSEARAKAVMEKMVEMGIAKERLRSAGHGQTNPIAPNNTTEGKAQNRRVEFVKI